MHPRTIATSVFLAALVAALALMPLAALSGAGQEAQPDWSRLKVVAYPSGFTGFFDPDTGRLYIYDADLQRCLTIRQLDRLGSPLEKVDGRR